MSKMGENPQCLIVVFKLDLTLALSEQASLPTLRLNNQEYRDISDHSWNCFYDWLRCKSNRVIGVRFWLWNELSYLQERLTKYPYTRVGKEQKSIEILFSDNHQVEEDLSKDQEFYENRILVAENHEYAITFGTRYLYTTDLDEIRKANAIWETPVWDASK